MSVEDRYRDRYRRGDTPWDVGRPDFNLIEVVTGEPVAPCRALEVGCGTGDNALWLAGRGFEVVATDTSEVALGKAREKAEQAGLAVGFLDLDFLAEAVEAEPFGFAFDRGCLHSFDSPEDRARFARNVAACLEEGGRWLTIAGSADERREGPGPPRRSAADLVLAVEPCFEILHLSASRFESDRPEPPRAWRCLMRKRV